MEYTWNKEYLIKDGQPWLPVMGELHYSRFKADFWEESLRKMKAGGVEIVSTYVIWIHHEEEEGKILFHGSLNLQRFARLCQKVGLGLFLRLGPWCHGEVRNGGFPDWLLKKGLRLRSDDPEYLRYVEILWREVYRQIDGLLSSQGGPVIGVQIENEYGHAGGYGGEEGERHMRTLAALAKRIGFCVPYYTATGWGGAVTGGLLPVMGGYCDAPWDRRLTELEANENFVFSENRDDASIANDYESGGRLTFLQGDFPYLTAELGGGLQPTWHRRPVPSPEDIGAMSLTKLGSGAAMLGYYMYHGGSNPIGKFSTFQESTAQGSPNDLPIINYDFSAPIRQYGQIADAYKEIKLLALFLQDFGAQLASLPAWIDPDNVSPEDTQTLRLAWRHDEEGGYLFYNNYQRKRRMKDHRGVRLIGRCSLPVEFPETDILAGEYGFFPYRRSFGEHVLISALATPLCRLAGEETCYVFYGDREPCFCWENGQGPEVLQIGRKDALNAWKVTLDRDYLILSQDYVWEENGSLRIAGGRETKIKSYPALPSLPGFEACGQEGSFYCYVRRIEGKGSGTSFRLTETSLDQADYEVTLTYGENVEDCFLILEYEGDSMQIKRDGVLLNDHFYTGQRVELSMRYFDFPQSLQISVKGLYKNAPRYLERWPEIEGEKVCRLIGAEVREQCKYS